MPELSQSTQKLINRYQMWYQSLQPKEEAATLHVDEVASKVAAFYEKVRGIIDWQEEHLLKRRAIERALKRRIFTGVDLSNNTGSGIQIAESLVLELIRGGHFPNDHIESTQTQEVQRVVDKYIFIIKNSPQNRKKSKLQLSNWLSAIAASEIEEILAPSIRERSLISYMFSLMQEKIRVKEGIFVIGGMGEKEKNIQIYIAVQRALFKLDPAIISYHLLKYQYEDWTNFSKEQLLEVAKNIYTVWGNIEKAFNHPMGNKFYHLCEKYDTPYLLLGDVISSDPVNIQKTISDPEALERLIKAAYQKRLKNLKKRLSRAAIYVTLSIFLSKIVVALAIEIPVDRYITGEFNSLALAVNILVPPLLMFMLVATTRPPKKGNLEQVIMEVMKLAYTGKKTDTYEVRTAPKRTFLLEALISLFYLISFLISLGLIIWVLYALQFPIFSYVIFVVFISLIAFAGTKIRQRSRELHVIERKEPFFHIIFDPFAIPLVQLGKWLTARWQRYNVLASFFNVLIDVPFLLFVEFLEQWRYFLKEKKEEIH